MKNKIFKYMTAFVVAIIGFITFSTKVQAFDRTKVVMFSGLLSSSKTSSSTDKTAAIYGISQLYYKNDNNYSMYNSDKKQGFESTNHRTGDAFLSINYDNVEAELCPDYIVEGSSKDSANAALDTYKYGEYCKVKTDLFDVAKGSLIRSMFVYLMMSSDGSVLIYAQSGYEVYNVNIYYGIANKSNDAQLYCDTTNTTCLNNKSTVTGSSWKKMPLSNRWTETVWESSNYMTLGKIYSFSVVDLVNNNMSMKSLVQQYGMYVLISYDVKNEDNSDKVYHVGQDYTHLNEETNKLKEFKFTGMRTSSDTRDLVTGNLSSDSLRRISLDANALTPEMNNHYNSGYSIIEAGEKNNRVYEYENSTISEVAALVFAVEEDSGSLDDLWNMYDTIVKPAALAVTAILFVVFGIVNAVTIARSSDEPEIRKTAIKKIVGSFVGCVLIALVVIFARQFVDIMQSFIK